MTYEIFLSLGYYWRGTSQFLFNQNQFRSSCLIFIHFNRLNWISVSHYMSMVLMQKSADGMILCAYGSIEEFLFSFDEIYHELPNDVWP